MRKTPNTDTFCVVNFTEIFNPKNLITTPICCKSQNSTMIDLILTNCGSSFIKAPVLETGISGYHNMFSVFSNIVSLRD